MAAAQTLPGALLYLMQQALSAVHTQLHACTQALPQAAVAFAQHVRGMKQERILCTH